MRGAIRAGLAATLILIPQLAVPFAAAAGKGPVSSQPYVPPPAPPAPPPDPNPRLLTPTEEGRQDLVHGPGEQPLRDFNLIRSKIPPVLLEAMNDAYARPYPSDCQALAAQVRILSDAIGPDLDEPVSNTNPSLMNRGEVVTRDATLDALREGVSLRRYVRTALAPVLPTALAAGVIALALIHLHPAHSGLAAVVGAVVVVGLSWVVLVAVISHQEPELRAAILQRLRARRG